MPPLALIGLGALAAVATVGFAVILGQPRQGGLVQATATPEPTPTDSPTPPSASPAPETSDPTPSPTPTITGFDVAWTNLDWPDDLGVNDLMYDEDRDLWIAASGDQIWTSRDATTWTAAEVESAGCESPEEFCGWGISGIERLGDQLIAMGLKGFNGSDGTALVSWLSDDGMAWTLATNDLRTTAQGLVTAESNGTVLALTPVLTVPEGITVLNTSGDGLTWENSSESDGFRLHGAYGDEDGFVAAGTFIEDSAASSGMFQPVVRASSDGHSWRTLAVGMANDDILSAVARLPSGRYLAAGVSADGTTIAWASNGDDEAWTMSRFGTVHVPEGFVMGQVVLADGPQGVVLAWNTGDGLSIATTIDGEHWTEIEAPDDAADFVFSTMDIAESTAVAFGGLRNPDNGFVPGLPSRGWIGAVTLHTD